MRLSAIAVALIFVVASMLFSMHKGAGVPFCKKQDLSCIGTFDVAAGNAYGTFILKNISMSSCRIIGNNTLLMQYPSAVTNIKITQTTKPTHAVLTLKPNESVQATVHYPNGPQCHSPLEKVDVMFIYEIAPGVVVPFMSNDTTNPFEITSCQARGDITFVRISPFA